MHILAENTILAGLQELGLVKGDYEKMVENRVMWYFMPHGLGHYLGTYVHDQPGLPEKENDWIDKKKMFLRFHRKLEVGMVITNEPGCYFNEDLLKMGLEDPNVKDFLQKDLIWEYMEEVGGVRIEDNFVVTEKGYECFTESLPREVEEIEQFMKSEN